MCYDPAMLPINIHENISNECNKCSPHYITMHQSDCSLHLITSPCTNQIVPGVCNPNPFKNAQINRITLFLSNLRSRLTGADFCLQTELVLNRCSIITITITKSYIT